MATSSKNEIPFFDDVGPKRSAGLGGKGSRKRARDTENAETRGAEITKPLDHIVSAANSASDSPQSKLQKRDANNATFIWLKKDIELLIDAMENDEVLNGFNEARRDGFKIQSSWRYVSDLMIKARPELAESGLRGDICRFKWTYLKRHYQRVSLKGKSNPNWVWFEKMRAVLRKSANVTSPVYRLQSVAEPDGASLPRSGLRQSRGEPVPMNIAPAPALKAVPVLIPARSTNDPLRDIALFMEERTRIEREKVDVLRHIEEILLSLSSTRR